MSAIAPLTLLGSVLLKILRDRRPLYEVVLVHNLRSLISMTTLFSPAHWA